MSTAITESTTPVVGGYATSRVTGAFTPTADILLLCHVSLQTAGGSVSNITGHGTWSLIDLHAGPTYGATEVWGCITSGSPSSSAVTVNHTSAISGVTVVEVDADFTGASVAASVVQAVSAAAYNSSPYNAGVTLASFGDSGNLTVLFASVQGSSEAATFGFTSPMIEDNQQTSTSLNQACASYIGEDLTPEITNNLDYNDVFAIGLELVYQGGGAGSSDINFTAGRRGVGRGILRKVG